MKNNWTKRLLGVGAVLLAMPLLATASSRPPKPEKTMEAKVRHELVMLPWYGVFDNIGFQIANGKVILSGQVTRPTLKSDAERAVKSVAGVTGVENKIEVLPLSPFDDRLRFAVLRLVYGDPAMTRYGMGAQPSIRIIVENGNVTLEGAVANEMDRNIANIRANQVPGVFSVTNHLRIG